MHPELDGLALDIVHFLIEICWMYVNHRILPRLQVIGIEVRKNFDHQSGIDMEEKILFRVESQVCDLVAQSAE